VTLRAGFARRDITQPLGTPSSLGLFTTVTEIWDSLSATAVVLESEGERVALVGLDLCGLLEASHRSIREAVARRTGLAADRVILNVSHSHSAPYISGDLQELLRPYGLRLHDDDYAASLETAVAEAVAQAADTATPARVMVGRGVVERVAGNRRPKLPDGRTVHRYGRPPQELRDLPEGLIDPEVMVVRFDRPDGGPLGALMSYSCHPTASGLGYPTNVSADFVGHGRTMVEDATGLTCVFLQGCAGNVGTGKWASRTPWDDTVAMGDRFARGVTEALRTAVPIEACELLVTRSSLRLDLDAMPVAQLEVEFDAAARETASADIVAIGDRLVLARRLDELAVAPIVTIRLGPAFAIVVLPGEVFLEHGLRIRAASPFADTLVAAYNDNTLQYIPTETAFPDGAYEVDGGWRYIRPGEGERLADEAVRLLETLRA
jgi:neutral ceramidase